MSTFEGIVKEIPYIRVDRFNTYDRNTRLFFITHCHTDHQVGLNPNFFEYLLKKDLFLYSTPISIRILKSDYPQYSDRLKEIHVGETSLLTTDYKGKEVCLKVSMIPAGHCPGSVMFLFETASEKVLCTGDFRIDNMQQFMNKYFKSEGKIDTIYLDTTWCLKRYPHFPSRKASLEGLCRVIKDWLGMDENNLIRFDLPARYGSEYLFMEVTKETGHKIHVSSGRYELHKFIPEMDDVVQVESSHRHRVHACWKKCDVLKNTQAVYICTIKISAWAWEDYEIGEDVVRRESSNFYRICASYHPSYREICEFIEYLKPNRVVPCVEPTDDEDKWEMLQLLDDVLKGCSKRIESEKVAINLKKSPTAEKSKSKRAIFNLDNLLASPPRRPRNE